MDTRPGVGFWYNSRDVRDAAGSAAKAREAGAVRVHVPTDAVDGRLMPREHVVASVEAARRLGLDADLYSFPAALSVDHVRARVERAADIAVDCGVRRVIVDAEPHAGEDWNSAEFAVADEAIRSRGLSAAWSVFPRRVWSRGTVRVPPGPIFLQVYRSIASADDVRAAMAVWAGREIALSVGSYDEERAGMLARDLRAALALASVVDVWCLASTDARERAAVRSVIGG